MASLDECIPYHMYVLYSCMVNIICIIFNNNYSIQINVDLIFHRPTCVNLCQLLINTSAKLTSLKRWVNVERRFLEPPDHFDHITRASVNNALQNGRTPVSDPLHLNRHFITLRNHWNRTRNKITYLVGIWQNLTKFDTVSKSCLLHLKTAL